MPEMTWSQMRDAAKEQGFEPLPIGTFDMRVEGTKLVPGKGSHQIQARLVVTTGPIAGRSTVTRLVPYKNDGEVNGMFFQQMAALGVPDSDPIWGQLEQLGFEQGLGYLAQKIDGVMAVVEIDHQNWNGELRDNVKRIRPYQGQIPGTMAGAPMQPGGMMPQAPPPMPPAQAQPYAPQPPYQAPAAPQAPPTPPMAPQQPGTPPGAPPIPPAGIPDPAGPPPVAPAPPVSPPIPPMPVGPQQEQPGGVQPVAPVENPSI